MLIVTGSVRPNSVNKKVVPLVEAEVEKQGATAQIADLGAINLPFFDAPLPPGAPEFTPTNDAAKQWTQLVAEADAVIFVTPEYNHTLTPLQMNAIDWIGREWAGKPVSLIGYGWTSGAAQAHATAREALAANLKANVRDVQANLFMAKDLDAEGTPLEGGRAAEKIAAAVADLLAA